MYQENNCEMMKLGDVCKIITGYTFKSTNFTKNKIDIPILKVKNIKNGEVIHNENDDRIAYNEEYDKYCVISGDFLISMIGTIGKVGGYFNNEYAYITNNLGKISEIKKNKVLKSYLIYLLKFKENLI